ncbi:MAG TPA: hypothetical protein PKL09_03825 [bacterium]|nr:hypothetical protein [bacterium]HNS34367.1 hypothetical protein [bacterium]HNW09242.1 hypothetical protein [bacterium]HNZ73636.1 hypothetical protein [bacterium]HOH67326.1 hypothetical protein [bacterium]
MAESTVAILGRRRYNSIFRIFSNNLLIFSLDEVARILGESNSRESVQNRLDFLVAHKFLGRTNGYYHLPR